MVDADGVLVQGCTIQNFNGDGLEVGDSANDDVTVRNNRFIGNDGEGLNHEGDRFLIENNEARGNFLNGFHIFDSDNGTARRNTAYGNDKAGIKCTDSDNNEFLNNRVDHNRKGGIKCEDSDNNLFQGNRLTANGKVGLKANGDGNTLIRNLVQGSEKECFNVFGFDADNTLTRNVAIGCGDKCYRIADDDVELGHNKALNCAGDGFSVDCDFSQCEIYHNVSLNATNDGFSVKHIEDSTFTSNRSRHSGGRGFKLKNNEGVTFDKNRATHNGREGFVDECQNFGDADGCNNTYTRNTATWNGLDGFHFRGNEEGTPTVKIINNRSDRNGADGIDVDRETSGSFTIENNRVTRNAGAGIENDAKDSDINNNLVKNNHPDMCGEGDDGNGTVDTFSGNTFGTGGDDIECPGSGFDDD